MKVYTTLNRIKAARPCNDGLQDFLRHVGKDLMEDWPIYASDLLEAKVPLSYLIWGAENALNVEKPYGERLLIDFACDCAERVLPLFEKEFPGDSRPRLAIKIARIRDFAITPNILNTIRDDEFETLINADTVRDAAYIALARAAAYGAQEAGCGINKDDDTSIDYTVGFSAAYAAHAAESAVRKLVFVGAYANLAADYAVKAAVYADAETRKSEEARKAKVEAENLWQRTRLTQYLSGEL